MKLFKVERTDEYGYDDYIDFVCLANSKEEAQFMSPEPEYYVWEGRWVYSHRRDQAVSYMPWPKDPAKDVNVIEIFPEDRTEPEVLCASFHAD